MVIERGRRREYPNQHFVLLLLKKIRGKKVREQKYGKIRGKSKGKSHVTSGDVTSGHAQWSDPPHGSSTNVALSVPIYY